MAHSAIDDTWPALPFLEWKETAKALHMWTQIVGKVRLALSPWTNHSWHVTLYLTARGLTTSPIYFGSRVFEIDFDFVDHTLRLQTGETSGSKSLREKIVRLAPKPVATFYREVMTALRELEIAVKINTTPNEVDPAIPFEQNKSDMAYDPNYATRFWRVLSGVLAAEFNSAIKGVHGRFVLNGVFTARLSHE